jgi:hypothetical protein
MVSSSSEEHNGGSSGGFISGSGGDGSGSGGSGGLAASGTFASGDVYGGGSGARDGGLGGNGSGSSDGGSDGMSSPSSAPRYRSRSPVPRTSSLNPFHVDFNVDESRLGEIVKWVHSKPPQLMVEWFISHVKSNSNATHEWVNNNVGESTLPMMIFKLL